MSQGDRCDVCGYVFGKYGTKYTTGKMDFCWTCLCAYAKDHKIIRHYIPGCVDVTEVDIYEWTDLKTFLEDHYEPGVEWSYSYRPPNFLYLMEGRWVMWIVENDSIKKEITQGLKGWKHE